MPRSEDDRLDFFDSWNVVPDLQRVAITPISLDLGLIHFNW
jgi:hypothetical protein